MKTKFLIFILCIYSIPLLSDTVFQGRIIGTDENKVDTKLPADDVDTDKHINFNNEKFNIDSDDNINIKDTIDINSVSDKDKLNIKDDNKKDFQINDINKKKYEIETKPPPKKSKLKYLYYILGVAGLFVILA
jgi:hypothetical protein